jgi:hypothetical protein
LGTYSKVRLLAEQARQLTIDIRDAEEHLRDLNARLARIVNDELVGAMGEEDVRMLELERDGNKPALVLELGTSIHASIPKSWDEEKRSKAFALLPDSIVKVTVTEYFDRGKRERASELAKSLVAQGLNVRLDQDVHHSTLTAWVRAKYEDGEELPDLESIGAAIVPRVKITEAKE